MPTVKTKKLSANKKAKLRKAVRLSNKVGHENSTLKDLIQKRLGQTVFVRASKLWLDTGDEDFNAVVGSPTLGMPAGKLYHFAGKKHVAKTALAAFLMGLAQRIHNAFGLWVDAEASFDRPWWKRLGVKLSENFFYRVYPKVMTRKTQRKKGKKVTKAGTPFLQSAEYLMAEAEEVMAVIKEESPDRPIFMVVDSLANLQTEMQVSLGPTEQNMRSALDRAQFLSSALPRLVSLADNYTMWVCLLNQIRTKQGVVFGNPEYSPGGNAMDHNCHVMVNVRRKGTGLEGEGKNVSIGGYMVNEKNKAGGGSQQGALCKYTVRFGKPFNKMWKFSKMEKKKKKEYA